MSVPMNVRAAHTLTQPASDATRSHSKSDADSEFEAIFKTHYERILTVLMRLVRERSDAEELTNGVFWKLYKQPASAQVWTNPSAWLYRTAIHLGIDALRASGKRKHYERGAGLHVQETQTGAEQLDELLRAEDAERVRAVLRSMKPAQAQILLMRASGSSYREIAESLQIAVSGVGTLLNRAEAEFRKRYMRVIGHKENL